MKLLLTGASGQLGRSFVELCQSQQIDLCGCDRKLLDIADLAAVTEKIRQQKPDYVINAAAYTAVDSAEVEQEAAFRVNHAGVDNLANVCSAQGVVLIHISTDYVFNGKLSAPYAESDLPKPLGVYGLSKLRGEEAVRQRLRQHIILRVSWIFGPHGQNFVKTIQRLSRERRELTIVDDQKGAPTSTENISKVILAIINKIECGSFVDYGTYHYADTPATNWFEFAKIIVSETQQYEHLVVENISAIPTTEFPTPAMRPMNSVLDCSKLKQIFSMEQASWEPPLRQMIQELSRL